MLFNMSLCFDVYFLYMKKGFKNFLFIAIKVEVVLQTSQNNPHMLA
jgi:hypothetical protein